MSPSLLMFNSLWLMRTGIGTAGITKEHFHFLPESLKQQFPKESKFILANMVILSSNVIY